MSLETEAATHYEGKIYICYFLKEGGGESYHFQSLPISISTQINHIMRNYIASERWLKKC